ncbi:GntP family permease [Brachyspira pilosicoli]|uniref:GntP family permease n=1 Tax=Brachyspira pilosicoli TaxID=52584 RepID=UPI000E19332D|nr:SLC13 family permease [Brachyspira pilosicoli]MBW5391951.1 GntP family permease [Brachyspira pilosicoli]WIH83541.1 GntP family permease [Brachyspira pilosicoli]SUW09564.1 gluconate transporter [Brachyspira pilosicoli]
MIFAILVISIAIILFCILFLKLNPAISLILGAIFIGLTSNIGAVTTINKIASGFGNLMGGIGLSVGFGVILGQLMSDSGAAKVIAQTLIKTSSKKFALYALGLTGFILSIPVFYDVTFVILAPLAFAVSKQINKPIHYTIGVMIIGAGAAHTLVPPTPNPLAAADILKFDIGIMSLVGLIIGLITSLATMRIYIFLMDKGFWNKEKDELGIENYNNKNENAVSEENMPSFIASLVPIVLPVILILMSTIVGIFVDTVPPIITFFSHKIIALLMGVLSAYIISSKSMTKTQMDNSATEALKSCGIVLLITGAGGSFGEVINATGISTMIAENIKNISSTPVLALLIAFFVAALFRVALGSGTVASITTMNIMASIPAEIGIHPVWLAIICLSGSLSMGHVNDSGFWVSTNIAGFSITGGLKTYTLGNAIVAVLAAIISIIGAMFIHF